MVGDPGIWPLRGFVFLFYLFISKICIVVGLADFFLGTEIILFGTESRSNSLDTYFRLSATFGEVVAVEIRTHFNLVKGKTDTCDKGNIFTNWIPRFVVKNELWC